MNHEKKTFFIVLLALALAPLVSRIVLQAGPSDSLKTVYDALLNSRTFRNTQAIYNDSDDESSFEALLEGNSITFTKTYGNEEPISWVFVQNGDWLTAPFGSAEESSQGCAYMLLEAAVSAQGVNAMFIGYINALTELIGKCYDASETENRVSVNIVGPYEYDMDVMSALAPNEEALREQGWMPLSEDYDAFFANFGKIDMRRFGNADGVEISVLEYGGLDELALQAVISAAKVLQTKGWEDFVASYTELKDADEDSFTARVNLDEASIASLEDLFIHQREGYSNAYFSIGRIELD